MRRAPFRPSRSMIRALGIELVVPGGGYFYVGEAGQGLAMVSFSVLAAVTAVATGESGVAGWVPIVTWFKIASMVHLVDEVYDNGPIVLQKQCAVYTDDTKDTLADRVFALECEALPEAVLLAAEGRLRLDDNQVCIAEQGETWSDALFSRR